VRQSFRDLRHLDFVRGADQDLIAEHQKFVEGTERVQRRSYADFLKFAIRRVWRETPSLLAT
jgi:hypothetical protein